MSKFGHPIYMLQIIWLVIKESSNKRQSGVAGDKLCLSSHHPLPLPWFWCLAYISGRQNCSEDGFSLILRTMPLSFQYTRHAKNEAFMSSFPLCPSPSAAAAIQPGAPAQFPSPLSLFLWLEASPLKSISVALDSSGWISIWFLFLILSFFYLNPGFPPRQEEKWAPTFQDGSTSRL